MLVVLGIIAILIGASIGGYSAMTKSADRARCQEVVSNAATALTALFQNEGSWPKTLALNGATDGKLDENTAYALVANGRSYFSLTTKDGKLSGHDRFGILTPWAQAVVKRQGTSASKGSKVGSMTVDDHILHYALDLDGDGAIEGVNPASTVEGLPSKLAKPVNVRATAAVWCRGPRGKLVTSWTDGQTEGVR